MLILAFFAYDRCMASTQFSGLILTTLKINTIAFGHIPVDFDKIWDFCVFLAHIFHNFRPISLKFLEQLYMVRQSPKLLNLLLGNAVRYKDTNQRQSTCFSAF